MPSLAALRMFAVFAVFVVFVLLALPACEPVTWHLRTGFEPAPGTTTYDHDFPLRAGLRIYSACRGGDFCAEKFEPLSLVSTEFELPSDAPCSIGEPHECEVGASPEHASGELGCLYTLEWSGPGLCVARIKAVLENGDEPEHCWWNVAFEDAERMIATTGCSGDGCGDARPAADAFCGDFPQ